VLFVREFRRLRDQRSSRYNDFRLLHSDRYLLCNLLGRGGFSEVYSVRASP
jgi:tousled-like kinase